MTDLIDLRMHQHIAHELYRQQMMQRIPDPFPTMLPVPVPPMHAMALPPRYSLPGVEIKLQNKELWREFHKIGTEMIITKSGRRMFPSMRLTVDGLDADTNYCVLLEMMPISDCRFKFSGSQWVPAGGAEPQSPQRFCLHPDSPALGTHWASQPIVFNKVKLTNNTLDNNGHVVLTSMHKYQPRIHIIRTSDPSQIPWAAQQAFVFPETEFVAVTAYQNDRITKLKIDNNPFAKGFRETGQSRCKRKMGCNASTSSASSSSSHAGPHGSGTGSGGSGGGYGDADGQLTDDEDRHELYHGKRSRSNADSPDDCGSPHGQPTAHHHQPSMRHFPPGSAVGPELLLMRHYNQMFNPGWMDLMLPYFARQPPYHVPHHPVSPHAHPITHLHSSATPQIDVDQASERQQTASPPGSPRSSQTIHRPAAIRIDPGVPGSSGPASPIQSSEGGAPVADSEDQAAAAAGAAAVAIAGEGSAEADRKINFSIASILLL
ncbi:T-box transcription factor TBX6-like [Anopheles aquasalis]|uniref:T-box transcription factor TBX6-like n=1 Tax=Anopheles aquasalis TaxID=42839 RepID=UPI00215B33A5|nr:T-box transcription factor TBX6-like [Anopheles aquasalis]